MKLPENIEEQIKLALLEDIGSGDVTADLIPENNLSKANVVCRDNAILCGVPWFNEVFKQIDPSIDIKWNFQDGDVIKANSIICSLFGNARAILSGERAALNFVQSLSATATLTNEFVSKIKSANTQILDTRKTIPNLREAQKYAVLCGGGKNHRIGLYDMILIKENHIMAAGSITVAVTQAKKLHPDIKVEVEAETIEDYREASNAGADIVMLDNFGQNLMREVVVENSESSNKVILEASGGINLDTVYGVADTGVDYVSVGEITKDIKAVDLSMRFEV